MILIPSGEIILVMIIPENRGKRISYRAINGQREWKLISYTDCIKHKDAVEGESDLHIGQSNSGLESSPYQSEQGERIIPCFVVYMKSPSYFMYMMIPVQF